MTGPGVWFITVHSHRNLHLFGEVAEGKMRCNDLGRTVAKCWNEVALRFPHVRRDASVVMPNHFHALLNLVASDARLIARRERIERFGRPVPGSVSTILRSFKAASTGRIRVLIGQPIIIWQARFHDSRVCGAEGIERVRRYIADNPIRWEKTMCRGATVG